MVFHVRVRRKKKKKKTTPISDHFRKANNNIPLGVYMRRVFLVSFLSCFSVVIDGAFLSYLMMIFRIKHGRACMVYDLTINRLGTILCECSGTRSEKSFVHNSIRLRTRDIIALLSFL